MKDLIRDIVRALVDLPDEVLRKLYYQNAAKLIPGVAERIEALGLRQPHDKRESP